MDGCRGLRPDVSILPGDWSSRSEKMKIQQPGQTLGGAQFSAFEAGKMVSGWDREPSCSSGLFQLEGGDYGLIRRTELGG